MSRPLRPGLVAEGDSDCDFLLPVIDRQLNEILLSNPAADYDVFPTRRSVCVKKHGKQRFREEAAKLARQSQLVFVHADHHEAHEAEEMAAAIRQNAHHAVILVPKRETEAWLLADREAFRRVRGAETDRLPNDVEKEHDPKALLKKVMGPAGVDRPADYFELLGQDISLDVLKSVPAYRRWYDRTVDALKGLHYL
ncbi:DUF4276 family protein [Actinomadura spongiicola]|uniref:DUF4276 family protein n=1 Tax=Actinomadura spongiicola TaxID=2303421 RepID=UPI001313EE48|nr:DUF4276 family protein [Actinomadura spongiicola]